MQTLRKVAPAAVLVISAIFFAACGGSTPAAVSQTSAPTPDTRSGQAGPTSAPAAAPATNTVVAPKDILAPTDALPLPNGPGAQTAPQGGASASTGGPDGEWEGTTSDDLDISFSIRDGAIRYAFLYFKAYKLAGCDQKGILGAGTPIPDAPLQDNQFSLQLDDTNDEGVIHYTLAGSLTSNSEAEGTLETRAELNCGTGTAHATWTAKNTSVTTSEPTAIPTPTLVATSPVRLMNAFFEAINGKDVDAAVAMTANNVLYQIGSISGNGKTNLAALLTELVEDGYLIAPYNATESGGSLRFSAMVNGEIKDDNTIIIQDGKIVILTLK